MGPRIVEMIIDWRAKGGIMPPERLSAPPLTDHRQGVGTGLGVDRADRIIVTARGLDATVGAGSPAAAG